MREVDAADVSRLISELCVTANLVLRPDVRRALQRALSIEKSPRGREVLAQILENAEVAERERLPLCQDTGYFTVFIEMGKEVHLAGGGLQEAADEGVRRAQSEAKLRASVVNDVCFSRANTGDNTPAQLHLRLVEGEEFSVTVMPKGGGSDNASRVAMLPVSDGLEGVERFVLETIRASAADACPPVVVGVGVGSGFDGVGLLAKEALLRSVGEANPDPRLAEVEERLLNASNSSGIGPGGLGGNVTSLAVHIETAPCHMASLPVAVNLSCHVLRSARASLERR